MPECLQPEALPWHPYVGVSIGILAALGVVIPWLFDKANRNVRAICSMVFFFFVGLEYWAIREDRIQQNNEQAFARCEQLQNFKEIAGEIKASVRESKEQFSVEIEGLNKNLHQEEKTFQQTRPKADIEYSNIDWPPLSLLANSLPFKVNVHFVNKGRIPARNISKLVKLIVESPDEQGQARALQKFEEAWPIERKVAGVLLAQGDNHFQTFDQVGVPQNFLSSFRTGQLTIYVIFRAEYEDDNSRWGSDFCEARQTPSPGDPDGSITYSCRAYGGKLFNRPQYRLKQK
jgi:hypothetical protein